jgi:hypothetical protein
MENGMKKTVLTVFFCLWVFAGQSFANYVGEFIPGTAGRIGTIGYDLPNGTGEFYLHFGSGIDLDGDGNEEHDPASFNLVDSNFNLDTSRQFRLDWETAQFSGDAAVLNTGSLFWAGSLNDFFDRSYSGTLLIDGQVIVPDGFYGENGTGHVFQVDFNTLGVQGRSDVIALSMAKISVVPVPGTVWILGSCILGCLGFRKKYRG